MAEILNTEKKEPDYKGFGEHVSEWEEKGIPYGYKDLVELANKYNTPIPKWVDGKFIFEDEQQ